MAVQVPRPPLKGKKALVAGIANEHSIAYGCAKAFRELEATWPSPISTRSRNPTSSRWRKPWNADLHAAPMSASRVNSKHCSKRLRNNGPARHPGPFHRLRAQGGLAGGLLDCSADGFAKAMDISCHSFIRMAKLAAPLMTEGGTMSP